MTLAALDYLFVLGRIRHLVSHVISLLVSVSFSMYSETWMWARVHKRSKIVLSLMTALLVKRNMVKSQTQKNTGCSVICVHPFELSELRSNIQLIVVKKKSLNVLRQTLKKATTMNSNFVTKNFAMMKTTKTEYAASFSAALFTIFILFSAQQRNCISFFFVLLVRILKHLFARMNWFVELLSSRQTTSSCTCWHSRFAAA